MIHERHWLRSLLEYYHRLVNIYSAWSRYNKEQKDVILNRHQARNLGFVLIPEPEPEPFTFSFTCLVSIRLLTGACRCVQGPMCPQFGAHQAVDTPGHIPNYLNQGDLMCPWPDVMAWSVCFLDGGHVLVCVLIYLSLFVCGPACAWWINVNFNSNF